MALIFPLLILLNLEIVQIKVSKVKRNKTISQSKGMFNIDSRLFRTRQSVQVGKDLKDNPERIDRKSKIITIVEVLER